MNRWTHKTMGDVCRIVNGGTPKTKVVEYWDGPHAWITPAEMGGLDSPFTRTTRRTLSDQGLGKCAASLLPEYSVVLSSRAPIGYLIINEVPMATNQGCRGLIPCNQLHYKYLYYFLVDSISLLNELGTGTTFKELSATKLKSVLIPLPPLPEQKRIVAILDEAFVAIETATANTKKNLANAQELFESVLNRVFQPSKFAEVSGDCVLNGWRKTKLTEILQSFATVDPRKKPDDTFEYIDVSSISRKTFTIEKTVTLLGRHSPSRARRLVCAGDILFATIRPTLQRIAVVPDYLDGAICSTGYFVLRPRAEVLGRFLFYYLFTQMLLDEMTSLQRGASYPAVSDQDIKNQLIFLPPLSEQKKIVAVIDKLLAEKQSLERIYETKDRALAELKQSLLHQAFTGELTADAKAADRFLSEAGI